jgi:hypothetical protein
MSNPQTFGIEARLLRVRSLLPAQPGVDECTCDGGGWIVSLDREHYSAPGDAAMVRYTRCVCLEEALSPAPSALAGAA